jgi:pyrimidine operon attenuation protein/uracil phosphoribosyltransferase
MTGQHIWHIKVRRTDQAEPERAEPQLDHRRPPEHGEVIDAVMISGEKVRAKIDALHSSGVTHEIQAVEEHGNLPGHREADEDDF